MKTKKVQVVKNKVVPKANPAVVVAPAAASPAPVVNAPLDDVEKSPVDPKSAAIGAASGAKEDVPATPIVTSPTVISAPIATPAATTPAPVVNAPLEELEKAPVDPKSAAIGAASGAKEDVPSSTTPTVSATPAVVIPKDDDDSIEAPIKPKIEKKKVVEEEEQEITRTDKATGKTTV